MIYSICLVGAWVIWHVCYRFRVTGRKNLPRGGYVMICNHLSAADSIFLVLARFAWPRPVILAKEELFSIHPLLSWFFRQAGAVPVSRGKGDSAALDQVVEQLRRGRDLLIFPEGTRSHTGQMGRLKSGAFVVAAAAQKPIVPCRVLYQDGRPRFFRRVQLTVGKPLSLRELGLEGDWPHMPPPAALRQAKARCVQELERLERETLPAVQPQGRRGQR